MDHHCPTHCVCMYVACRAARSYPLRLGPSRLPPYTWASDPPPVALVTRVPAGDGDGDWPIARRGILRQSLPHRAFPRRRTAGPSRRRRRRGRARAEARGGVRPGGPAGLRDHAAERVVHRPRLPPARARSCLPPRMAGCRYARFPPVSI